jgi:hypothetical protein
MTLIIGFGNKAQNGKDTAVSAVVHHYATRKRMLLRDYGLRSSGPIAQRIGFADELYSVCRTEYGMTTKDAPLLQQIGASRRQDDPDYWIKRAFAKVDTGTDIVLVSDVRYKNEADYIRSQGGALVNVQRLNEDGRPFIDPSRPADHPSEIDLDDYNWDFYLKVKTGGVALLSEQAITLVEYIRGLEKR